MPQIKNKTYKSDTLQNALSFYNDSGMLDYAMEYARRLLKLGIEHDNPDSQCHAYYEMAVMEVSINKVQIAEDNLAKAYEFCSSASNTLISRHLPNLEATIMMEWGDLQKAKRLLESNDEEVNQYGWSILTASTEIKLANVYIAQSAYENAEKLLLKALSSSEEITDIKRSKNATLLLAQLYSKLDKKEDAIKYFQQYI